MVGRRVAAAFVVAIAALGSGGTASAHTSSYCGHANDGVVTITAWTHHVTNMAYPYHYNYYDHYQYLSWTKLHSAITACPGGV